MSIREVTAQDAEIRWTVHLANLKSYYPDQGQRFPNDPGPQAIGGLNQRVEVNGAVGDVPVQLGTLMTDDAGRLIVLGGFGESGPVRNDAGDPNGIYNAGWYDDTSDGPVRATLTFYGAGQAEAEPAWVIAGVPPYATPSECIVTLYDLAYDVALRQGLIMPPAQVSFFNDVYPVLLRSVMSQWVSSTGRAGHGRGARGDFLNPQIFDLLKTNSTSPPPLQARTGVFGKLKRPDGGGGGNMPALNGLAVTPYQYECFRRWAPGDFTPDWPAGHAPDNPPRPRPFHELSPLEQTFALDRAGLESTVGGSFSPGIEAGSVMGTPIYEAPFRIDRGLPAGTLTASLSIPWQSDFKICNQNWWPSARPGSVTVNGVDFHDWVPFGWSNRDMVEHWWELGFLKGEEMNGAPIYVERERLAEAPAGMALGEVPVPDEDLATFDEAEAFVTRMVSAAAAHRHRPPQ